MKSIRGVVDKKELPIILIVLVLLFAAGWVGRHYQKQKQTEKKAAEIPANWATYKNTSYGFQIHYPRSLGQPSVFEIPGQQGKSYSIHFSPPLPVSAGHQDDFTIHLDSSDLYTKTCYNHNSDMCSTTTALTQAEIQKALLNNKSGFIKYDTTSYGFIPPNNGHGTIGQLDIFQIVNLAKIKVSAAHGTYLVLGKTTDCPVAKLAPDTQSKCLTNALYDTVAKVLKSLQPLQTT
jgi:hypothetical protein